MSANNIFVCRVEAPDGIEDYVTLLSPDTFFSRGLCPEAIVGKLTRLLADHERITPKVFSRNRVFVDFMHEVIAGHAPRNADFQAEARRIGEGWIYVIDQRTPDPGGTVPPHDVVGSFKVSRGEVVPGSYTPNPNHVILSPDGFFSLGPNLDRALRDQMLARLSQ